MNYSDDYLFKNVEQEQQIAATQLEQVPVEPKTRLGLISMILFICGMVVPFLLNSLIDFFMWYSISEAAEVVCGLILLAAFILMIYTRVKYPKDVFGKITMWLFIVAIVFTILLIVFLMVACYSCTTALGELWS